MSFIDLIYPKRCPVCLEALPPGKTLICPPCKEKIRRVTSPTCMKCGKPLMEESFEYCGNCEKRMPLFVKGLSYAEYTSKYVRRMLSEVKYHENPQILDYPCLDFGDRIRDEVALWGAEALIPVPVHPSKLKSRGYNQAEEIASRLGKALSLPVDPGYLFRSEKTEAQKNLTEQERRNNLATAFFVPSSHKTYESVILVDDIYTTGSTANACTRVLLASGISRVYLLTLAIGRDNRLTF